MSVRKIAAHTASGMIRTRLFYKRGDWAVTAPLLGDCSSGIRYRVTHIPTGGCASTPTHRVFEMDVARRIVNRNAKEMPRRKSFKGIMKHRELGARIIREEWERKP